MVSSRSLSSDKDFENKLVVAPWFVKGAFQLRVCDRSVAVSKAAKKTSAFL
jgi:hypothetical protein